MDAMEIFIVAGATILGPVLAVQAQKWVERATERTRARRAIFHALMSNRATRLSDDFVRSLNLIDLEFSPRRGLRGSKDRAVVDAWRSLFGEYQQYAVSTEAQRIAWNQRIEDRLVALLSAMSAALGYEFSEEELRRGIYYPLGRVEIENAQIAILHGLRQLLEGHASFPMKVTEFPSSPELVAAQVALAKRSADAYDEDGAMRVRLLNADEGVQSPVRRRGA